MKAVGAEKPSKGKSGRRGCLLEEPPLLTEREVIDEFLDLWVLMKITERGQGLSQKGYVLAASPCRKRVSKAFFMAYEEEPKALYYIFHAEPVLEDIEAIRTLLDDPKCIEEVWQRRKRYRAGIGLGW